MNEWSHDHDKPLEFLDEVWAEDYFVRDPISHDRRVRVCFFTLELVASPVDDRERSAFEQVYVTVRG